MNEKRKRLTKERFNSDKNELTLEDMIINSGDYDAVGHLTNAKLRQRLKEYEDKEFGEELIYGKQTN